MTAFHNDPALKARILAQIAAHREADEIIKGKYWENGKGCAVGCTVHGSNHADYEIELGIPQATAYLEDTIFEGLENGIAMLWPERFMNAVPVGADTGRVQWKFLHWLLTDEVVNPGINHPLAKESAARVAAIMLLLGDGAPVDSTEIRSAAESAYSAAYSARSAAYSAESARSAYSARAAESAAYSAESAAESAESAAESARSAYSAYKLMADKLEQLLSESK